MSWQRRWAQPSGSAADRQLAVFVIGELEYAVDIMRISQIVQARPSRPVPGTPDYIEGVVELRQAVIPVVDLRSRFGLERAPVTRRSKLIVVRLEDKLVGMAVDRVIGMIRVSQGAIRRTPEWITGAESRVFVGVCRRDDHLVLVVDLDALLTSDEKLELGRVRLDSERDWSGSELAPERVEEGGSDVDDWWESD